MLYYLGRTLQIAGLVILPLVVMLEFEGQLGFRDMLAGFLFGAALFYIGRTMTGNPSL